MIGLITMAGAGSRFAKSGYSMPKFLIEYKGKTLFEHSLESLPLEIFDKVVFVVLKEHYEKFEIEKLISSFNLNGFEIVQLSSITKGQAETAALAEKHFDLQSDLLIYNIDTSFSSSSIKSKLLNDDLKKDGILGAFRSSDDKYSFAKLSDGIVVETAEKIPISEYALTGLYHFSKAQDFLESYENSKRNNILVKGEMYVAPMYNYLIQTGKKYTIDIVDSYLPLGTPEDLI